MGRFPFHATALRRVSSYEWREARLPGWQIPRLPGWQIPCGQHESSSLLLSAAIAVYARNSGDLRAPIHVWFPLPSNTARTSRARSSPLAPDRPSHAALRAAPCRHILPGPAVREDTDGGGVCRAHPRASTPSSHHPAQKPAGAPQQTKLAKDWLPQNSLPPPARSARAPAGLPAPRDHSAASRKLSPPAAIAGIV